MQFKMSSAICFNSDQSKILSFFILEFCLEYLSIDLIISVYLSSLPIAHLSDAPRRRLVVTGDSARIQDETTENSAWFFNVLSVKHRHTGPQFNVSSERQLIVLVGQPGTQTHTCRDP